MNMTHSHSNFQFETIAGDASFFRRKNLFVFVVVAVQLQAHKKLKPKHSRFAVNLQAMNYRFTCRGRFKWKWSVNSRSKYVFQRYRSCAIITINRRTCISQLCSQNPITNTTLAHRTRHSQYILYWQTETARRHIVWIAACQIYKGCNWSDKDARRALKIYSQHRQSR